MRATALSRSGNVQSQKRLMDVILTATATALLLVLIARDDIGMPADMVREDALSAAGFVFAAVSLAHMANT